MISHFRKIVKNKNNFSDELHQNMHAFQYIYLYELQQITFRHTTLESA